MTRRLLAANAVIALSLLPTPAMMPRLFAQEPPVSTFRSSIDVVSVSAVVRDRKGRFVGNLERKDFIVAEAGQPGRFSTSAHRPMGRSSSRCFSTSAGACGWEPRR